MNLKLDGINVFKLNKPGLTVSYYLIATVICLCAWIATYIIFTWGVRSPFLFSLAATALSAWLGGWRVGLYATVLSIIGVNYLFFQPGDLYISQLSELIHVIVFAAIAVFISWLEAARRHSEVLQRNARNQLEVILRGVADGITVQNKVGQPIFANDAAALLTGYPTAKSMIETPILDARRRMEAFDDDGSPLSFDQLPNRRALAEGITGRKSFKLRFLDTSEERWVVIHSSPVFDDTGKPIMAINIFRDITESKQYEMKLRREQEHLNAVLDNMPVGVAVLDQDGIVLTTNKAAVEFAGLGQESVIGTRVDRVSVLKKVPGAHERIADNLQRARQGELIRYDTISVGASGETFDMDFSVSPMRNADGVVTNLIMTSIDITARKEAEKQRAELTQALADQSRRLYEILANMPGMVWEASGDPSVLQHPTFVSEYALKLTGYSVDEWISRPNMWIDIVHPDDRQLAMSDTSRIYEQGSGILRTRWITKDNRTIYIESHSSVFYDPGGKPIGVRGVTMDITARRQSDEALTQYSNELKRSNEDLQQFAYVASHDLQEPLRMVTSYLQLVSNRYSAKLDDDAREFIEYAVDGASRMKSLINDLLSYARVESRGAKFEVFQSREILDAALYNLQMTITEHNVQFKIGSLPEILGDTVQFTQLFQNLIANAIKFRREHTALIQIGATRQTDAWEFFVKDDGIGIEPQYLERIFVIFQRLHPRGKFDGTGIGLAICKRVVERHGGTIRAESTLGQGTTVYFTVPLRLSQTVNPLVQTTVPVSEIRESKRNIPILPLPE